MTAVESVLHPVIVTGDMTAALAFYRDLLGFRLKHEMVHDPMLLARLGGPPEAEATAVVLGAPDGSEIELACFKNPRGRPRTDAHWQDAGIRSITFVVSRLDDLLAALAAAGFGALGHVEPFVVDGRTARVVYVDGPDGVIITFLERGGLAS